MAWKISTYLGFVESSLFMRHFHFLLTPLIPHSTLTCILLNVCIASWFTFWTSFHHPILHMTKFPHPCTLDTPKRYLKWSSPCLKCGINFNRWKNIIKCSHMIRPSSLHLCTWIVHDGPKYLCCSLHRSSSHWTRSYAPHYYKDSKSQPKCYLWTQYILAIHVDVYQGQLVLWASTNKSHEQVHH